MSCAVHAWQLSDLVRTHRQIFFYKASPSPDRRSAITSDLDLPVARFLLNGMLRLLWSDETMPVNVGNPREMTMTEFAQAVLAAAGSQCRSTITHVNPSAERIADDPQRRRPDITRARTILGWEPQVPLAAGLVKTIEYFKALPRT